MKKITGIEPVKTFAKKRIPEWGLRHGLPIGCKMTLRKDVATKILMQLLEAKECALHEKNFDAEGNVAFGIHEYIDIPGIKYDPDIGIMGLEVCVTLERPGYRIKRRRKKTKVGKKHHITKKDAIEFMTNTYQVKVS